MKRLALTAAALTLLALPASADDYVNGYLRQNGTYVNPYMRTAPDSNPFNNYSTQGNVNPYTGALGTHNPYAVPTPSYGLGSGTRPYNPYGPR